MEVDRLERPDVARDGQRVLADEQVLERLEPVHRVARADADHALVGLDPDERHGEAGPRHGSQAAGKGGSSGHAQALQADGGDAASIAPVSPTPVADAVLSRPTDRSTGRSPLPEESGR